MGKANAKKNLLKLRHKSASFGLRNKLFFVCISPVKVFFVSLFLYI